MGCTNQIQTVPGAYTAGDLEHPITIAWNEALTTETSDLLIEQPDGTVVTLTGALVEASTGTFQYVFSTGDLVPGEGQLCKARLFFSGGTRRKSTMFFRINVEEDIT